MKIKAFCERTALSRDTVNFYVGRGLLTPGKESNGYRDFDEAQVGRARMIADAKALGFTLAQINDLSGRYAGMDDDDRADVLREQLAEVGERRAALDRLETTLRPKLRGFTARR